MKRREFLKVAPTVGAASLILESCGKPEKLIPLLVSPDELAPGEESWVHSVCQSCSAGCGIDVRLMQGESVRSVEGQERRVKALMVKKIEGNPHHPVSMGGTCARGQAAVQALYHPDRLQGPMKSAGARGSGTHQPIEWKDAAQLLVSQLQPLLSSPQQIAILAGRRHRGTMGVVVERFGAGLGTPNIASYEPFDPQPIRTAMERLTGVARLPFVDFQNADYLLSFNANLFESFLSPVRNTYSYGVFRQGRPGLRGRFVHAEPRLSQTAACADEWLPIRPGTEGLLALAIAYVIVNEQLHDTEFLAQHTSGFAEWTQTLSGFAPETVGPQVDIRPETIARIAREFASYRTPVAVGDSRDTDSLTAIYALNALVGAFGRRGGVLVESGETSGPVPAMAPSGDIGSLIQSMANGQIKALLVLDGNPLFTLPEQDTLRTALAGVPFIVSFSSFLDETAAMADLILPNHVPLERWIDDVPDPGVGYAVRTLAQPAVPPRWNSRDTGDVLIETARALGGKPAEALPFEDMAAAIKESFRSLHTQNAEARTAEPDFDAFFKKAVADGGWWARQVEAVSAEGRRATGEEQGSGGAGVSGVKIQLAAAAAAPAVFSGDPGQFPFMLHLYPSQAFADGRTAHLPWLQEMPDPMTTVMWGSWVEVNPQTALKLGVQEGDILKVASANGSLDLPVYVYPGLRPDVIAIPVGQGHSQYGRYASNRGANPLRLGATRFDRAAGAALLTGVRVSAQKTGDRQVLIRFGSDAREHIDQPPHR